MAKINWRFENREDRVVPLVVAGMGMTSPGQLQRLVVTLSQKRYMGHCLQSALDLTDHVV
jgi:hypothetical protein